MNRLLFTLLIFSTSQAEKNCSGVYFNNRYHEIQILKDGLNGIHQLILNHNDNTLYFIFDKTASTTAAGYLDLENFKSSFIDGIRNASGIAIDSINNKIYIGGVDGLYTIDSVHKMPKALPVSDEIQSLFFKDYLFYTNRRKEAYVFHHGHVSTLSELQGYHADNLVLDDDNNILFTEGKTLFTVKLGTKAVNIHEKYIVDLITTDNYYKPYICTREGIYVYNKYKLVLDKISNLTNLRGLTFTKDDSPIYAVLDLIIKLHFTSVPCYKS